MYQFFFFFTIVSVMFLSNCSCITTFWYNNLDTEDLVLIGNIRIENNQLSADGKWWLANENDTNQTDVSEGTEFEVDIVNCAGYLASAKMANQTKTIWQAKVLVETVAPDIVEKITICKESPNSPNLTGKAFAVKKEKQRELKLENPNLNKVFKSLPWSVQSWANCESSDDPEDCVRKEKDILSRKVGDNWADTDGDGEIDLIIVKGNCNNSGDYTCSRTMRKIYGSWIEIAYSKPA